MPVYQIDPLLDRRWPDFVAAHPKASVFHTRGWLQTLHRTYGYEPVVFTTSAPGSDLTNGIVFCHIKSWLTGSRLVSVPFADHCDPLVETADDFYSILDWTSRKVKRNDIDYVEIRPLQHPSADLAEHTAFGVEKSFCFHKLDLAPSLVDMCRRFDKDCVQRTLRRTARENLAFEQGSDLVLLKKFYHLMVMTRRRHRLPPQPIEWFRNLIDALGENIKIRAISKDSFPMASILTLAYNGSVIYKYGCSDPLFNRLAGTTQLFWQAIEDAKQSGAHTFDMGRSDADNEGLIRFKSNWGTARSLLTYWRCPRPQGQLTSIWSKGRDAASAMLTRLPDRILIATGKVLYKHAG